MLGSSFVVPVVFLRFACYPELSCIFRSRYFIPVSISILDGEFEEFISIVAMLQVEFEWCLFRSLEVVVCLMWSGILWADIRVCSIFCFN